MCTIKKKKKKLFIHQFLLPNKTVANCDQNNHQIRFWLLNNYKIKVMIEFSDQLSQDSWYLTLVTNLVTKTLVANVSS